MEGNEYAWVWCSRSACLSRAGERSSPQPDGTCPGSFIKILGEYKEELAEPSCQWPGLQTWRRGASRRVQAVLSRADQISAAHLNLSCTSAHISCIWILEKMFVSKANGVDSAPRCASASPDGDTLAGYQPMETTQVGDTGGSIGWWTVGEGGGGGSKGMFCVRMFKDLLGAGIDSFIYFSFIFSLSAWLHFHLPIINYRFIYNDKPIN